MLSIVPGHSKNTLDPTVYTLRGPALIVKTRNRPAELSYAREDDRFALPAIHTAQEQGIGVDRIVTLMKN